MGRKLVYVARRMRPVAVCGVTIVMMVLVTGGAASQNIPRRQRPPLPAIPAVTGPLTVRIVYPSDGASLTARDSTFFFGSVGTGSATLSVNGLIVPVAPNGAFLAWLALGADTLQEFRFVARLGADSAVRVLRVRVPVPAVPPDGGAWLDAGSLSPRGARWAEPGELIRVSLTASPGALVVLRLPGGDDSVVLAPDTGVSLEYGPFDRTPSRRAGRVRSRYVGGFVARELGRPLPRVTVPDPGRAPDTARAAWVEVTTPAGTRQVPWPLRLGILEPADRPVVLLDDDSARSGATDGAVTGAPLSDGTFHWFFRNGTVAQVTGRAGDQVRLRLSRGAIAWVPLAGVAAVLPHGTPPPAATVGLVRLFPRADRVTARFRMSQRVPFRVDEDERAITVRFYSTVMDLDWVQYGGTDPFIPLVTWAQPTEDEGTVTFRLGAPVFGWQARWEGSDLVLDIRRPPAVSARAPLRGRTIAVDPGHPPAGATGPTGLREAVANLAVALELRRQLEARGARVIMTRTTDTAIGLYERTVQAESASADLLVSIHNNAFPDGVNPWENNGTSTYYFHPRSVGLAVAVQRALVAGLGLRDLGIGRGDLALARPTWMPAVLTEGAFLMIPEQEQALRTPGFQRAYAAAVVRGIEAYFRERWR